MKHTNKVVSLFHVAVKRGRSHVAQAMLEKEVVSKGERSIELRNAIASGDVTIVKLLLDQSRISGHEIKLDERLCQAIRLGHESIVLLLIQEGASPSAIDYRGNSTLAIAIQSQNIPLVNHLLKFGVDPAYVDRHGNSIAMMAASCSSVEILESVLHAGARTDYALSSAVRNNHYSNVRLLLLQGVNVNEANEMGITPLIFSILHGNVRIIKLLVQHGANLDWQDINGDSALMYAARYKRSDLFRLLVGLGASTKMINNQGENAYDLVLR